MYNKRFGAQITRSSAGQRGGVGPNAGKASAKFLCTGPKGQQKTKRVFNAADFQEPVSVWYEHAGVWYLNTVLDKKNLPDWAANYTLCPAEKVG